MEWDPGPTGNVRTIFEQAPLAEYEALPQKFRLEWGPIYYRGRTDGSARVLVIGQDPAADENVTRRILCGHAGQRVQGYLTKLGLTRSYVMVNSVLYSIFGQFDDTMQTFMDRPANEAWRNSLLDALVGSQTEAVLAFGKAAKHVVDRWPGAAPLKAQGRVFFLTHPTARPESAVVTNWNGKLNAIGAKVTPDPDGNVDLSKYPGPNFKKADHVRIPLRDLGFGSPAWLGDGNSAVRVSGSKPVPSAATKRPSILWTATGDKG